MNLFPFFQDVENKSFLVVGGGKTAKDKIEKILKFTGRITVVARETDLVSKDGIKVIKRDFEDGDVELGDICIAATSDRDLNAHIAGLCGNRNIPVNVVDDRNLCSFIFPSIVKKGDLTVGIVTSGKSPLYSRTLREQIEGIVPDNIEAILDRMNCYRDVLKENVPDQPARRKILKALLDVLLETGGNVTDEELQAAMIGMYKEKQHEEG